MRSAQQDKYVVQFHETPQGRMRSRVFGAHQDKPTPVVVLMGLGVSDYLIPAVAALSGWRQSHLVDLPGLGGSGPATHRLDVAGYADAVGAWLEVAGLPPVVLIGNSSSTQVAARVAAVKPDKVRGLVLASPTVDPKARSWPRVLFFWRWDSRYPMPGLQQQHTPEWVRAGLRQLVHVVAVHLHDHIEDILGEVRCPVLVLRGSHDGLSTEAWARELATTARDGRFVAMPGPHSFVWTTPTAWCEPVRSFTDRLVQ